MAKTSAFFSMQGRRTEVHIGTRSFFVEPTSNEERENSCPAELIVAALGS